MGVQYAGVDSLLVTWAAGHFPNMRACTEVPANIDELLTTKDAVVRFQRFGGTERSVSLDDANVDVDVFAPTAAQAEDFAAQIRAALKFNLPGQTVGAAVVIRVNTINGPSWRPWDNTKVRRYGASYQVTTQSREATP
jgi:hypothetical protein